MNIHGSRGLTLIGFLIVLVVSLFFAYAGMKVIPMYLEYHALTNAMKQLEKEKGSGKLQPAQIKNRIQRSLWASYADNNIKKRHMQVSKTTEGVRVRVAYEVRKPFLGNIDIVGKFDRSAILSP